MKDIINITLPPKSEDIVMQITTTEEGIKYVIAETENTVSAENVDSFSIDSMNDFDDDLREMMQSAKNMSGGLQNVIDEVSKIDNIGPTDNLIGINCSIVFTPEEEKNNKPIWRPTSYQCFPTIDGLAKNIRI